MTKKQIYNIKTIDLSEIESSEDLQKELARVLDFPDFYEKNWDSFWNMINGLIEMPTNLIIYNSYSFYKRNEKEADLLRSLSFKFNTLKKREVILFDSLEGLTLEKLPDSIKIIFETRPSQFGLRGDDHLWKELEEYFSTQDIPDNEEKLVLKIHEGIKTLTGQFFKNGKDFFVKKYDTGGMSSGYVNYEFWTERGIPLLIGRYKKINKSE